MAQTPGRITQSRGGPDERQQNIITVVCHGFGQLTVGQRFRSRGCHSTSKNLSAGQSQIEHLSVAAPLTVFPHTGQT